MAGVTDLPFRLICKQFGADIVYSEMVSATGLFYNSEKSKKLLKTILKEQPIAIQLFGAEPDHFIKATRIISAEISSFKKERNDKALSNNSVDINFGCPVKKIVKQGAGCVLMEKPKLAKKIIQAVSKNTKLPVSIKIRAGIKNINALEFLKEISSLDWEAVIVHGRTYEKGFSGTVDLDLIKKIKQTYPDKIVIANGGIFTPEDARKTLEETNADGIAIARGALGNPWIFKQIEDYLKVGKYSKPKIEEIKKITLKHAELFIKYKGEKNIKEFRKHLGWYFKGIPGAKDIRKRLFKMKNLKDIIKILNEI